MNLEGLRGLYLDLLIRSLLNEIYPGSELEMLPARGPLKRAIALAATRAGYEIVRPVREGAREAGSYWPRFAHTMIGRKRLENLRGCLERAIADGIPGDFIEAGVWRGGGCILARGVFRAYGEARRVFVADSFEGLPPPSHDIDRSTKARELHEYAQLAVSVDEVKGNFAAYDLLDDQVVFLPGWFAETLPRLPAEQRFAVIRIDGDMYQSTRDAIGALYPRLSPGGFAIVDDYHDYEACRRAVDEYRDAHRVAAPIQDIDWTGIFWRKPGPE